MGAVAKWRNGRLLGATAAGIVLTGLGCAVPAAAAYRAPAVAVARDAGEIQTGDGPEEGVCSECAPPLLYHGGAVMGSHGTVTITPVYWSPRGNSAFDDVARTYRSLIDRYLRDIARASGSPGNVYRILPEYYQSVDGVTRHIRDSLAAGKPITDTHAYPGTGQCTPVNGEANDPLANNYTACITDDQLKDELKRLIKARHLPVGLSDIYAVFFPPHVQTTFGGYYANNFYCAYHSALKDADGRTIIYSDESFPAGCFAGSTPNDDKYADSAIDTLSHEVNEAISDPLANSWGDKKGNENGDECSNNFGPALGTVTTASGKQPYNQVINGDRYYTQTEFSNAAYRATGVGTGCRQGAYVAGDPPPPGLAVNLTVDASRDRLPANGSATATITVTATDAAGEPVAGDRVSVITRDDNATPSARCGLLSDGVPGPGDVRTTNAAGRVTVTYTASTVSGDCYILATDTTAGITDQTLLYQGTDTATAPAITDSELPSVLIAGGSPATFTATAANPVGGTDIGDARFGIYITGHSTGASGLSAGQLTLSYQDSATNGRFVPVRLTGTTAQGGEIFGLASPDTAEALLAGTERRATFRLSLAAGIDPTLSNLRIEVDLDQIDPADGSLTNLDRSVPGDVLVIQDADTATRSRLVAGTP
jgi:hypothetical protein